MMSALVLALALGDERSARQLRTLRLTGASVLLVRGLQLNTEGAGGPDCGGAGAGALLACDERLRGELRWGYGLRPRPRVGRCDDNDELVVGHVEHFEVLVRSGVEWEAESTSCA
jgi:hypothetical protein